MLLKQRIPEASPLTIKASIDEPFHSNKWLWPRKRGFEYVLLSVPGNSRVQRLHRQRCLRETPRSCSASGSFGLCNQRLSSVTTALRKEGKDVAIDVNHMVTLNLFTTITNANFDEVSIRTRVTETLKKTAELRAQLQDVSGLSEAALWSAPETDYAAKAAEVGVLSESNEDIRSLKETITYGLKGLAAYLHHANVLNHEDEDVDAFIQRALSDIQKKDISVDGLVALTLETGKYGVQGMALLDTANTDTYGQPEITEVDLGTRSNPGILISGHDLKDLEMLLDQTAGTGVDVYTHGEMLPGHYYPFFKKYPHFAGNYGNAWWKQRDEFESFNGPILMTTKLHRTSERQLQGASVDDRGCPVSGLPSYRRGCRWIERFQCHHRAG